MTHQPIFIVLAIVVALAAGNWAPRAHAHVIVQDKEWYQPGDLYDISWDSFASVCDVGTGYCNGSVNSHDLTGWTWADRGAVNDLFNFFLSLEGIGGDDFLDGVDYYSDRTGLWVPHVYDAGFQTTNITPFIFARQITGTLRDISSAGEFGLAQWSFDLGYSYWAWSGWTEPFPPGLFPQQGAWIYRSVAVPTPGSLMLMAVSLTCLVLRRLSP